MRYILLHVFLSGHHRALANLESHLCCGIVDESAESGVVGLALLALCLALCGRGLVWTSIAGTGGVRGLLGGGWW